MAGRFIDEFNPLFSGYSPVSRKKSDAETKVVEAKTVEANVAEVKKTETRISVIEEKIDLSPKRDNSDIQTLRSVEPVRKENALPEVPKVISVPRVSAFISSSLDDFQDKPKRIPPKVTHSSSFALPDQIDTTTGMFVGGSGFGTPRIRREALPQAELDEEEEVFQFERVNANQVKYQPLSKTNPTGAVIPLSMAEPTHQALLALQQRVGDIDQWLCERLQWSSEQLTHYITSEQADAVALAIDAADRGEGLIIADSTGFGKGRILACVARSMILSGKDVNFLTEKANLFSDFWRDIRDIGSEQLFGRPFLLNDGAKIVDTSSVDAKVLLPPWKKAEASKIIQGGVLPKGSPLSMSSYSQYSRKGRKTEYLSSVARGAHFVFDEAHNFVGDSTTRKTTGAALEVASSSTYSSATFGRDIINLSAYSTVFPWLSRMGDLNEFTPAQKRALAEESVLLATRAGRIIRREHDLSNMQLCLEEDEVNRERNEQFSDALAPVLSSMARLARQVDMLIKRRNEANQNLIENLSGEQRKIARETWFAANFGSRLNSLIGQFLVALQVDSCVDQCVKSLLDGEKPVVVIETTMESLMKELIQEAKENEKDLELDFEEAQAELPLTDEEENAVAEPPSTRPPTFKEALNIMATRLLRVSVRKGAAYEKEIVELAQPELLAIRDEILQLAETFPDLSLSPIDDIRDRIEQEGARLFEQGKIDKPWLADEISARSMRVVDGKYVPMPAHDRNTSVARFVNGSTHCLVLTNAAATGLSLHDSEKFADHARRHMILLRPPRNVVLLIQMLGRVFRRGQLTEPRFTMLSTGLPFQTYELAMQRRKIEGLSASVTGSGNTATSIDVFDPIDSLGNQVAYDFLTENQKLADHMGIPMKIDREEADREFYFVGKLLKRLPLLRARQQRAAFNAFIDSYRDRMKTEISAHSGRNLEGTWKPVRREVLEAGDGSSDPLTGRDLFVTTIRTTKESNPLRSTDVKLLIEESSQGLAKDPYREWREEIKQRRATILQGALHTRRFRSVEEALKSNEENSVKLADAKLAFMCSLLEKLRPGCAAILPGDDGDLRVAAITDISLPDIARATRAREYKISYLLPGDENVRSISLDSLVRDTKLSVISEHSATDLYREFDASPAGVIEVDRKVLDGNGLAAVLFSRRMKVGTRTSYTDDRGRQKNAILIPKTAEHALATQAGHTTSSAIASKILDAGGKIWTNPEIQTMGVQIEPLRNREKFEITIPNGVRDAKPYETPEMIALVGKFDGGNWIAGRKVTVARDKIGMALKLLSQAGYGFHFDSSHRKLSVEASKSLKSRNPVAGVEESFSPRP